MWHGPYSIIEKSNDVSFKVDWDEGEFDKNSQRTPWIHIDRMKPYFAPWERPTKHLNMDVEDLCMENFLPVDSWEDVLPEGEFEVERILKYRKERIRSNQIKYHYLIKWKGFGSNYNSWEPEDLLNCPDLLRDFWRRIKKKGST